MIEMASQITSLAIVYSIVYSDADQRKHQSSASLAFVRGIHRGPVNSPHKRAVTRKMFPFDDVIMRCQKWTPAVNSTGWQPPNLWRIIYLMAVTRCVDLCVWSRYQRQGQVITSHRNCGMQLLVLALDTRFKWQYSPRLVCEVASEDCVPVPNKINWDWGMDK